MLTACASCSTMNGVVIAKSSPRARFISRRQSWRVQQPSTKRCWSSRELDNLCFIDCSASRAAVTRSRSDCDPRAPQCPCRPPARLSEHRSMAAVSIPVLIVAIQVGALHVKSGTVILVEEVRKPPIPLNEHARLELLRQHGILDTGAEQAFDEITTRAAEICQTPSACPPSSIATARGSSRTPASIFARYPTRPRSAPTPSARTTSTWPRICW